MDSVTVGILALSFAIGFSFTEVLFRRRRRGLRYAVAMFLSIGFLLGFTRYVMQPYFHSLPAVRFSGSHQLLAAIERLEPPLTFGPGAGRAMSPAELRRRSLGTMTSHLGKASDEAIVALANTLVGNAEALQRQSPSICASYLFARTEGEPLDYARYLDERAINEDLTAIAVALESAASSPGAPSAPGDRERGMRTLRSRLSGRYTAADFELLERRGSLSGPEGAFVCRMAIDQYREALALPAPQRAAVLRNLMARRA